MHVDIVRDFFEADRDGSHGWTLSQFYVDGKLFGFTCEDVDRGLDSAMPLEEIKEKKIKGRTAIPVGTYKCGIHIHNGKPTIHLLDVPGYQWILVHSGNSEEDTEGCLLAGLARDIRRGLVIKSRVAMSWLDLHVLPKAQAGELTITVRRDPQAWAEFQQKIAPAATTGVLRVS